MDYFTYKEMQYLFLVNEDNFSEYYDIYSLEFLNDLNSFIDLNLNCGFITDQIKERILILISNIRNNTSYNNETDRENRYDIYNDMIGKINKLNVNLEQKFCIIEALKRNPEEKLYFFEFSLSEIMYDYEILDVFLDDLSDNDLNVYSMNSMFISSINAIITENDEILNDSIFLENLLMILLLNLEKCDNFKVYKYNKKDAQFIKSRTNSLLDRIKEIRNEKILTKKIRLVISSFFFNRIN